MQIMPSRVRSSTQDSLHFRLNTFSTAGYSVSYILLTLLSLVFLATASHIVVDLSHCQALVEGESEIRQVYNCLEKVVTFPSRRETETSLQQPSSPKLS